MFFQNSPNKAAFHKKDKLFLEGEKIYPFDIRGEDSPSETFMRLVGKVRDLEERIRVLERRP